MGMIGYYRRISAEQLVAVQQKPETASRFFSFDEIVGVSDDYHLDINKAWHGLHFLLTGTADEGEPPLSKVVLGGTPLQVEPEIEPDEDEVDLDVPITFVSPAEVKEVAAALSQISKADLAARFEPTAMEEAEIYPLGVWDEEDAFETVGTWYEDVRAFFQKAAAAGDAILFYLSI